MYTTRRLDRGDDGSTALPTAAGRAIRPARSIRDCCRERYLLGPAVVPVAQSVDLGQRGTS